MDAVTILLLIVSTWQAYFAVPTCLEADQDGTKWLSWLWLSVKLMWCIMFPILFGTWHRVAVLKSTEQSYNTCTNLEHDVSLKSEVAKNWHARYSTNTLMNWFQNWFFFGFVSVIKYEKYIVLTGSCFCLVTSLAFNVLVILICWCVHIWHCILLNTVNVLYSAGLELRPQTTRLFKWNSIRTKAIFIVGIILHAISLLRAFILMGISC